MEDGGVRIYLPRELWGMRCVCGRCSCDASIGLGLLAALCGPFTSQRRLTLRQE